MSKETFVRAYYRVTKKQDKWVKRQAYKNKCSEAEIIRTMINVGLESHENYAK